MTSNDPFANDPFFEQEPARPTHTQMELSDYQMGGFLWALIVPLGMGIFWALYLSSVADDSTQEKVFGVLAMTSVLWLALAGYALYSSLKDKHRHQSNPLALSGIIISSLQLFFGAALTPIYFAIWHEVPATTGF